MSLRSGHRHRLFRPTSPPGNGSIRSQSVGNNFIPAYQLLSIGKEEFLHIAHEPRLQIFYRFKSFRADSLLATGALFPVIFLDFVTPHVYIFIRKEIENLFKDILTEFQRRILSRTNRRRECFSPADQSVTSEIRVLGNSSQEMPRHIYFRNHIDSSLCSIIYNFFDIFMRIVTTIQSISFYNPYFVFRNQEVGIVLFYRTLHTTTVVLVKFTPRSFFRQQRIFLDFNPPSLIIRQMPVELIQFIQGH